jgi:hypothetical protein
MSSRNDLVKDVKSDCPSFFVKVVPANVAEALEWVEVLSRLLAVVFPHKEDVIRSAVSGFLPVFSLRDFFCRAGKSVEV